MVDLWRWTCCAFPFSWSLAMEEGAAAAAATATTATAAMAALQTTQEAASLDQGSMESESESVPELPILFLTVALVLGLLCRHILKGTRISYTGGLLVLGIAMGAAEYGTNGALGTLGDSIRVWSNISPSLILFAFLPALLFESSFAMEVHQVKRCIMQMVLLAGPGVVISTFASGILVHYIFPYQWSWSTSLLLGGLLSATDPVAVVALLKELGASKKLNTLIEGESLMNDGTAIVIYRLFLKLVLGESFSAITVISFLSRVAFGGVAIGLAFGIISVLWLGLVFNDTVIEITLTLTASYIAYYTAEDEASVSGVLAVMAVGIFFAVFARAAFKGETQESMHIFWELVAYIANTLIFILSGVVIAESMLKNSNYIEGQDWGYLFLLYLFLQVSRAIVVVTLLPGLRYFGYGLTWKEASMLTWSGLRGAVALSLSLSVYATDTTDSSGNLILSNRTRARFVFLTGGVVFLTLIINGSTAQFLLQFLKLQITSEVKARILEYTKYEMNLKAVEAFENLGEDEELGPAEWHIVTKYISCLATTEPPSHPHVTQSSVVEVHGNQLQDTRLRLLNGVQAAYWTMLEERRITQTSALILMQSVDEALDLVMKNEGLDDWKGLNPHVQFPRYLKHLWLRNSKILPKKMVNLLVVERLELGCYISAAFLRAHRIARRQLREFIGESLIADMVIRESEAEESAAKTFLEDVRLTFPEVLRAVKTKQVTNAILNHLIEYVRGLERVGLLETKETMHLHDHVQADMKRLLRNPPLVKMPTTTEILRSHPFLAIQPAEIRESLKASAKESMRLRASLLYRENSRPDGVYLIANGVVKWNNKSSMGKIMLHPTFSHGSTLGLYEVLTGKPYLCDLTADSLVHCFFIEASQILSALRIRPEVEELFWMESSLGLARVILPEIFEEIPLQEVRALAMNRSIMRTYLQGEIIDILPAQVGLLLEGFLKQEGGEEILIAPCVLKPNNGDSFRGKSNEQPAFQVETRSRVILFDMSALHPPLLRRASTSLMSSTSLSLVPRPGCEHDGLLRWPDVRKPSELQLLNSSMRMSAKSLDLAASTNIGSRANSRTTMVSQPSMPNIRVPRRHMSSSAVTIETGGGSGAQKGTSKEHNQRKKKTKSGNTSDESDADDENIILVESPSSLFRHHHHQPPQ